MRNILRLQRLLVFLTVVQVTCITEARAQNQYAFAGHKVSNDQFSNPSSQDVKQTLFTALKELNRTKGVYFLYSDESIGNKLVEPVKDAKGDVEKILDRLLQNTGLKYKKVSNNTYVILVAKDDPKKPDNSGSGNSAQLLMATEAATVVAASKEIPDPITGKVKGADGKPLAGVTVTVKGTARGTSTNADGEFTIEANKGEVLVFSSVGFQALEMVITDANQTVTLQEAKGELNEVVVTALGIQRKAKSLTYSTQQLSGGELSNVKDANVINGLAGKAAGVTITRSSSGVGGSARVIMRGNKSTRENQPLYVIDGVPMANFSPAQPTDVWGQSSGAGSGGRDGGDGISNINPEDIESVNVLKGASASALYGSQAANGVILITTKKGRSGTSIINFSSNYTLETPLLQPELQFRYAQTTPPNTTTGTTGTAESWGAKTSVPDHVTDFYDNGHTWINSVSFSGGTTAAQTYFSYSNTTSKGMLPSSKFDRHTINFRETFKTFNDKLGIDANFSFITQKNNNRPVSGMYNNPLTGLDLFPRGLDFNTFKNQYEYFSPARNMYLQNWWNINYDKGWVGDDNQQNPYWSLFRNLREDSRDRGIASLVLRYPLTSWLNIQARGNFDKSYDKYELKSNAGTQAVLAASNGRYTLERSVNQQLYGDAIATGTFHLTSNLNLVANLGGSILDLKGNDRIFFDTDPTANPGLGFANKFFVSNILPTSLYSEASMDRKQVQSAFGSAQLGWKDHLFLDLTARNDWSSTLAFTPTKDNGFFYYSAGLTSVLSEMLPFPEFINFAKVRVSYAKVGNDIPPYLTNPPANYIRTSNGEVKKIINTKASYPGIYLKPEDNRSFEVGTEWRFWGSRLGLDFTYYKNNNFDQYIEIPAPLGSGFSKYYLNLGNIQNQGIEATLTIMPLSSSNGIKWTSVFNLAANDNKVVELSNPNIAGAGPDNKFELTGFGVNMFGSYIKEGGSWGDIYTNKEVIRNANGEMVLDADGAPQTNSTGVFKLLGNPNPDFMLGWNNTFDYKNFSFSFLVDGRFGGDVMSVTQAVLDKYGVSEASAAARDAGGVSVSAVSSTGAKVTTVDAHKYYNSLGGRDGAGEVFMYDATNVRLRELALSYQFPTKSRYIRSVSVGVVGRNLFFFKKEAPFDPETSMATNNGLQGVDVFGLPSIRSYGLNLKFVF